MFHGVIEQVILDGGLWLWQPWDDTRSNLGVRSEAAVVADHVETSRRYESAQARKKVEGVEDDGRCAILPGAFHGVADRAVITDPESVLSDGWPCGVSDGPFEAVSVPAIYGASNKQAVAQKVEGSAGGLGP